MDKLLELVYEFFKGYCEKHLPSITRLIRKIIGWKAFAFSWGANYSRKYGIKAFLIIGVIASLYAAFLFATRTLSPDMPKPSHDVILKSRFASPVPSEQILIVDIDERTLALLSDKYGRWPWSRDVLADGLQKISDLKARAVLFNVMLSDPDKNNADADAAMDVTAQLVRPIAFPLIRLAPQNDKDSKLKVVQIPGVKILPEQQQNATLAAILPMFSSMHDRLGVANQKPDEDGIVRKYSLKWEETGYTLPTIVGRTLEVSDNSIDALPDTLSLNWRNKRGRYTRVSFGDLLQENLNILEKEKINNAYIVLSVSAPGIGQTKATGVSAFEDDGEILATALDDALNNTYLRTMPDWLVLLINLTIIWGLIWVMMNNSVTAKANKLFVVLQASLGGVTLISASYTNYLIDMSDSMSFGIGLFGCIKLLQSLDDSWSRAKPGFRKIGLKYGAEQLLLLGWLDGKITSPDAIRLQRDLESVVGMPRLVRVDDLFAGESFVKSLCSNYKCILIHINPSLKNHVDSLINASCYADVVRLTHDLQAEWDTEDKLFVLEVAPLILNLGSELLHQAWLESVEN